MAVRNRLKRDNLLRILEQLWRYPGKSRADLARELDRGCWTKGGRPFCHPWWRL